MKVNELRIGNYVAEHECDPFYFQVEEIRKYVGSDLWVYYRSGSIKTKEPEPIPLTEEWFLKLGFNYHNPFQDEDSDFYVFQIKTSKGESITFGYASDVNGWFTDRLLITVNIYYVHQLQNLYFALTGEELKLTEK
jgi:hypothetical protein